MAFATEIWPYRNDRRELPRRLLEKLDSEFQAVEAVGSHPARTIGGRRTSIQFNAGTIGEQLTGTGHTTRTINYRANVTDKKVCRVLLKAWLRRISDRYLDYFAVTEVARARLGSIDDAYSLMTDHSPVRCVKFLYNELPRARGPMTLFGSELPRDISYNQYFSRLVAWDDGHLLGLVQRLSAMNHRLQLGGGSTVGSAWQAAAIWIARAQRDAKKSVYSQMAE